MNQDKSFIEYLQDRLSKPLPGIESQKKLMPRFEQNLFRSFKPKADTKKSAVLIILHTINDQINIMLTLRSSNLGHHSGQISFPGGRAENNETAEETALRETLEEIGLDLPKEKIIGSLTELYVPPSNNLIYPIVAFTENIEPLTLSPDEVEEAFYVPIEFLAEESNLQTQQQNIEGFEVDVPYWDLRKKTPLWGATAMILSEIADLYNEYKLENP